MHLSLCFYHAFLWASVQSQHVILHNTFLDCIEHKCRHRDDRRVSVSMSQYTALCLSAARTCASILWLRSPGHRLAASCSTSQPPVHSFHSYCGAFVYTFYTFYTQFASRLNIAGKGVLKQEEPPALMLATARLVMTDTAA